MKTKALGIDRARTWLVRLIVLLIVLLAGMYVVYVLAHPGGSSWSKFWAYGNSAVARTISIGLFLPIILLLIQIVFNVGGVIEERIMREREALHQKRLECIERTRQAWNDFYDLASEVCHLPVSSDSSEAARRMLIKAENLANRGEEVVDMWHIRFGLPREHEEVFLTFMNVLLHGATTVAQAIADGDEAQGCRNLQDCLGVIQEWVKAVAHHRMSIVLEHRTELLRLEDGPGSPDDIKAKKSVIQDDMKPLAAWAKHLWVEQINDAILPGLEGPEISEFRQKAKVAQDWLVQNPGERISKSPGLPDLEKTFDSIPRQSLLSEWKIPYSKNLVRELARWFAFESVAYDLEGRARHLRTIADDSVAQADDET